MLGDVTPEAGPEIATRELPGFGETMRMQSMRITPNAILSRNLAAVVDKSLVICLPGKPSGAVECLGFVALAAALCQSLAGGANQLLNYATGFFSFVFGFGGCCDDGMRQPEEGANGGPAGVCCRAGASRPGATS